MFFILVSVIVPVILYLFLPRIIRFLTGKILARDMILLLACLIYFISWYLPSPLIHGENTAFTTHFVGGGIFSGLVWLYLQRQMRWEMSWSIELISVFAWVSMLGVANELFELATAEFHITQLTGTDTCWDLLANTLGALTFWVVYRLTVHRTPR